MLNFIIFFTLKKFDRFFNLQHLQKLSVAIIGSGPAGFYTAQHLLSANKEIKVDIYEKYPVPFGLVRFGVAPDHPEVKNVENTFLKTAHNERCQFYGNVSIGKDILVQELKQAYTAIVFANSASNDKLFNIPGEDLEGVHSARSFVEWYNGLPGSEANKFNLDTDECVILGQGNVAIDVARILLTPLQHLQNTDITEHALDTLSRSRIKKVLLVGRRGPLQVAFTIAEFREMLRLPDCRPVLDKIYCDNLLDKINEVPRSRKRLIELISKTACDQDAATLTEKEFHVRFFRSPKEFLPTTNSNKLAQIRFSVTELQNNKAVITDKEEIISTTLAFRSIGYKSSSLDPTIPFDDGKGVISNINGKIVGHSGLYCSGWVKTGPVGVIASTMNESFETARVLLSDVENKNMEVKTIDAKSVIDSLLKERGVKFVNVEGWQKIDREEIRRGRLKNKPREKIVAINEMIDIAYS